MKGKTVFFLLPMALLSFGCTRLFFQPSSVLYPGLDSTGVRYETVRFSSLDKTELTGIFFPSTLDPAKGTVVHFHGNAENMTTHLFFSYWLAERGFNVFVFDYRGYGASEGVPSVKGAVEDGVAAIRYVRGRKDVDPDKLLVFGQSLGGALAVASISQGGFSGIRALVLESPFSSYRSIAQDKLSRFFLTWPLQRPLSRLLISDRFSPAELIGGLPSFPILVIHGDSDPIIPYREGKILFERAREPKEFWTVPGGRHTQAFTRFGSLYRPKLEEFFTKALK